MRQWSTYSVFKDLMTRQRKFGTSYSWEGSWGSSRLCRRRFLQSNPYWDKDLFRKRDWKALDEIYQIDGLVHLSKLNIFTVFVFNLLVNFWRCRTQLFVGKSQLLNVIEIFVTCVSLCCYHFDKFNESFQDVFEKKSTLFRRSPKIYKTQ